MKNKITVTLDLPDGRCYHSDIFPVVGLKKELPDLSVDARNDVSDEYLDTLQPLVRFLSRYYEIGEAVGVETSP